MPLLACNTEEEFSLVRDVQLYDPSTDTYSTVNWVSAGYIVGDSITDLTKGKFTFSLGAQSNGSVPTIEVAGVPTAGSGVAFKVLTTTLAILTFNAPSSAMVCDYTIEYEKTGGNDTKKEVGQFVFNSSTNS